jgi:NAD+ synthetase
MPLDVAIGFFELYRDRVYNSALYARLGADPEVLHVHRKVFLPTYGVFQEERFVDAGHTVRAFDTAWGRAAILICEDVFHSLSATLAALDGAQLILVPSASPARGFAPGAGVPGNVSQWDRVLRTVAEEHGVFVAAAQILGFEGGKGFPGGSVVYSPRGEAIARAPLWEETLLTVQIDMREISAARVEQPLLSDLERALPGLLLHRPATTAEESARPEESQPPPEGPGPARIAPSPTELIGRARSPLELAGARRPPPVTAPPGPEDSSPLAIDTGLVERWLIEFLREEVSRRRGFRNVVVGLSGGVDSSLTAALCARALGPEAVRGFLLPYHSSSPESREHALLVAEWLGIETREIDITGAVDGYAERFEPEMSDHRRGNVAARQRMIVLFDQAVKFEALPVGTGNKSERLLGYFTWHADDSPPINPLGDLFKVQVWELAQAMEVPDEIVAKPASADLIRGQTDEEDLGIRYAQADLILHHLLSGNTPDQLEEFGFDAAKVRLVHGRLEGTHWKRHLPTVPMLSSTAIGEWYLRPVDY